MNKIPVACPSCFQNLSIKSLQCASCMTEVKGSYAIPDFLLLDNDEQKFILEFIIQSGNLKNMAEKMGLSYPTVRNYLNEIIQKIKPFSLSN